ncbi:protein kinase C delta type-like [Xenopus laevis]|uniref:Protein kinase C delta type-like n=1 Tax=Xenopus laevis TaxID=8355 RepID=A0A8J1KQS0_XENLA|nr:protein kinase C delta type-like [Xenopus laevis]
MDLSERRRCPAGQVVKSCIEGKTNKDWIKESGERKSDAANDDKKICRNAQTSLYRSIKRRWRVEKQTENKKKIIKRINIEKGKISKESQAEKKTSKDERIKRRRFEEGDIEKESQAEKKTIKDERIKRRRFEEGEIEKESQAEKKTSEGESTKGRAVEEGQLQKESQAKKKTSKLERSKTSQVDVDDKKIREENSKGRNIKQNEDNNKRSRSEDPLEEGGSIQKRPCLDIERPATLDSDNYKFHTVLGQGGFGWVILASFRPKKQLVAIKILKKQKNNCDSIAKEARLLKISRECAFLCHSYATFQSELEAFFVLEYASGKSLWQMILRDGNLPMSRIIFYTAEMVVALQFLHSKGIIHRDLKPDNVLVDKDGHIKICDFGLAKENITGQRNNYGLAGTRGYRAPEVLLQDEYNAAVDWWSFGVIMYEMATGKLPYSTSGSILNQTYAIMTETPDYPSYMSEEMLDLLSKLLESDDTKRIGLNGNIREHPFYSTINWDDLENRRLETPFQPGMPSADDFYEFPLPFSTHNCNGKNLKDFSEVDPNWNWQE